MRILAILNILCLSATKLCRNCRFFIPERFAEKYEVGNYLGKCKKFGYVDTNTSEIEHTYSFIARSNEKQCGKAAKHHEKLYREESFFSE